VTSREVVELANAAHPSNAWGTGKA